MFDKSKILALTGLVYTPKWHATIPILAIPNIIYIFLHTSHSNSFIFSIFDHILSRAVKQMENVSVSVSTFIHAYNNNYF